MLDDLADILSVASRGDQQGVLGFNHHQVAHPHQCDELLWAVDVVAGRVDCKASTSLGNVLVGVRMGSLGVGVVVEGGPGAKVVPAKIGAEAKQVGSSLAFGRARLQHGNVNADVLALRIELSEDALELRRAESINNFL